MAYQPLEDRYLEEENLLLDGVEEDGPFADPLPELEYTRPVFQRKENNRSKPFGSSRLVIAIDYGTTYTGLAFAYADSVDADLGGIEVVQNWTPKMSNQQKVRSLISYTTAPNGEAQWGTDISKNATTMVNTKLELELQDSLFDELDLTLNVLKGTGDLEFECLRRAGPNPDYTCKSPIEIVTDYLANVFECARNEIDLDALEQTGTSVDIVVTVPVNWSYEANNSTFKAIRKAGFNKANFPTLKDTILVTEPEAASHFTARDLQASGTEFLQVGDCFILCDAGGGTVDVVSFQVKRTEPYLELKKATEPTSGKCGSVFIDTAFKNWVRKVLGPDEYERLDPANGKRRLSAHTVESGPMRTLIERFEEKKKQYTSSSGDVKISLPLPSGHLNIKNTVNDGELTIPCREMRKLMDDCASSVTELVLDQIDKIRVDKHRRTRNLFLVGGFGASHYLREQLREGLEMRNMQLWRPDGDKPWTAVVQGAVIYGIEKSRHKDAQYMSAMTKSYAIKVGSELKWLIRKGDLVLSTDERHVKSEWFKIAREDMASFQLPIYAYSDHDGKDDVPDSFEDGRYEINRVGAVKCDLTRYLDSTLRASYMYGHVPSTDRGNARFGPLRCQIQLSSSSMRAAVFFDKVQIGTTEISVEVDHLPHEASDYV